MATKDIISYYNLFKKELASRRLTKSIATLRNMASMVKSSWRFAAEIDSVADSYGYLRRYALDGVEDPQRNSMLDDIVSRLGSIGGQIVRSSMLSDSPRQYFNIARYEELQSDGSIRELLSRYADMYAAYSSSSLFGGDSQDVIKQKRELDALSVRIFNVVWTTFPIDSDQQGIIEKALADSGLPEDFKLLLVSALTLGSLEYFDYRSMLILAKTYYSSTDRLEIRSLVGMMLILWTHRQSGKNIKLRDALNIVFEKKGWREDLRMVFLELVRTRDTERIARKLNEEVIPEMMKLRPEIMNKIDKEALSDDISSIEENPEWAELLSKSGIEDKLKELNDLQADGGDVMMSAFGQLKGFRFFNDVANWFMPFSLDHSSIKEIVDDTASDIGELIESSPMMCDSDKFSIILSLESLPSANRRMMLSQFKLQDINIAELKSSELNPELMSRKNICNKYIQDLYRFFNLYRRKSDFYNPFSAPINLASVDLISDFIEDSDSLAAVGEFYFKRGYYSEALDIFNIIIERGKGADSGLLQKCGYCCQQTGGIVQAIDFYRRSELLRPDSVWTHRRLAQCYRSNGDIDKALEYYLKVAEAKPDDMKIAMSIGNCYLEKSLYADALKYFYKVEFYTSDKSDKSLRPIAWTLFLSGDYEKSLNYYKKVVESSPTAQDYLNIGHLRMAMGHYQDALTSYRLAGADGQKAIDEIIMADIQYLEKAGIDPVMIDIVIDSLNS